MSEHKIRAIEHKLNADIRRWLQREREEQSKRYKKLVSEMDALDTEREGWVDDFLQRIQTEGFNVDGDMKVKIPANKIPKKPKNPKVKVVY